MTPEHVSELQSILRFLRANAFEKSEAALVEEVEALMRAAQLEKDDAERRLKASASGNNDESSDPSLNGEDPGRTSREVSNDAFGPMSPPAVSRPILGRFGSDVERAHAAMASEDAHEDEATENEARFAAGAENERRLRDEDAESVGTLDTFATPVGGGDDDDTCARTTISASECANRDSFDPEPAAVGDDEFSAAPDDAAPESERVGARDDFFDSASASDAEAASSADADVSFAIGTHPHGSDEPGVANSDAADHEPAVMRNGRLPACAPLALAANDDSGRARLFFDGAREFDLDLARADDSDRCIIGREDPEAQRSALRAWQTAPREEYEDFEDPGYVRARAPRGREARRRFRAREEEEAPPRTEPFLSSERLDAREEDDAHRFRDAGWDPHPGGFAFDSSPRTATPASERSEGVPPRGAERDEPAVARMGWGGSEFGGDSERGSRPISSSRASRGEEAGVPTGRAGGHLDGAADALRAWAHARDENGERETNADSGGSPPASAPAFSAKAKKSAAARDPRETNYSYDAEPGESAFETFSLKIVHRASRTGFEAHKDFPVVPGELVAGRFRVVGVLGAAAFSVAARAWDARARREVCLKIVKNDKDFFDQSLDEVKLLRMMNDADARDEKNIVRMLDFFYHREHLFIVTELLGLNLYEHQKLCLSRRAETAKQAKQSRRGARARRSASVVSDASASTDVSRRSLSEQTVSPPGSPEREPFPASTEGFTTPYFTVKALRAVAKQVLVALEFMHARGVIHCDVKPENIVLRRGDAAARRRLVKVIDLGSSCFTTDHLSSYVQSRSYRAPEVVLGAPYDGKVDLWSLGCVLAELFTGTVLLRNESTQTALARVIGIFGPLDPELLRLGKRSRALLTPAGVPYEDAEDASDDDETSLRSDGSEPGASRGRRTRRVLLPKRTSLAARLGLPPLGVARDSAANIWDFSQRAPNGARDGDGSPTSDSRDDANGAARGPPETHVTHPPPAETEPRASRSATEEKDGFIEFLLLLLQPNPRRRPTAAQALAHEWLAGDDDFDDFDDAWVPPQTSASPYGDARVRDILAQL